MFTADHIFLLLPFKDMINNYGGPTTSFQLATSMEPPMSHLRVLFCPYVVRKATEHDVTKALNIRHQAQKGFCGIFVGIP